jgi:exopolysaccharide biosynthesis polyprenyl glycosylphosphotransferase
MRGVLSTVTVRSPGGGLVVTAMTTDQEAGVQPRPGAAGLNRVRRLPGLHAAPGPLPSAARWERRFVLCLLVIDVTLVSIAVGGGLYLRFGEVGDVSFVNSAAAFLLAPTWVGLLAISRAYDRDRVRTGTEQVKALFEGTVRMAALVAFLAFLSKSQLSRGFFLLALPGGFLALVGGRLVAQMLLQRARRYGRCLHRVLAVGNVGDIEHLLRQLSRKERHGLRVVGACAVTSAAQVADGVPVLGIPSDARRVAAVVRADTVAVTSSGVLGREGVRQLAWQLEGSDTGLLLTPELTDVAGPRINVRPLGALSLLQVTEPKFSGASRILKGAFDRVVAGLSLLLLSPVLLAIAVIITLDTRGPVFFRQTRSGVGGAPFSLVKFRSMVPTAEDQLIDLTDKNESGGVLFKIRRDPRVTRVGRVLRRMSLDELPQLWNVFTGEMSLVGPRPPLPSEVELYAADARRRLLVKPGLTGLWQVSGRSDLSWEESVRLDLYYVENWSFALDLMIVARTVGAVVAGRGAY